MNEEIELQLLEDGKLKKGKGQEKKEVQFADLAASESDGSNHSEHEDDAEEEVKTDEQTQKEAESALKKIDMLRKIARRMQPKVQHGSERNEDWDSIMRIKETHILIISMIGLLLSIFLSFYKWSNRCVEDRNGQCSLLTEHIDGVKVTATWENTRVYMQTTRMVITITQGLLTLSTVACILLILQVYSLQLRDRRLEWSGKTELELVESSGAEARRRRKEFEASYSFVESSLRYKLILEVLIHLIHPIVFIEYQAPALQTVYEITESFVFVRLYLLVHVLYINSHIYRFRADIVKSNKELQRHGFRVSPTSTFKITFYNHPGTVMFAITALGCIVFGFMIFVIERNDNVQFESVYDSYWFVWVTLSTAGYGDLAPITTTGRILTIFMALYSLFMMTIFTGIITNLLAPSREQKYVQQYLLTRKAETEYRKAAVYFVEVMYKDRQRRKTDRNPSSASALGMRSPAVYQAIKRFRRSRLRLQQTIGAAADPVVDSKLQKLIYDSNNLTKMLDHQGQTIVELEYRLMKANEYVRARLSSGGREAFVGRPEWDQRFDIRRKAGL